MPEKRYKNVLKKISNYQKIRYVVTKYQTDFKSNNGKWMVTNYSAAPTQAIFCVGETDKNGMWEHKNILKSKFS